jgi:polyisoprenoid-binding protein YceI
MPPGAAACCACATPENGPPVLTYDERIRLAMTEILMNRSILLFALFFSSLPALGTETLIIDPSHTAVVFSWNHRGLSHPVARFEQISGSVLLDRSDITKSSVLVTLPVAGLHTGNDDLDRRLKGTEFLDAAAYPAITFKSTKIEALGTNKLRMTGEISVHGITQAAMLNVTINNIISGSDHKVNAGFDADVMLRRSDFGVGRYVPMTGDELSVHITIEAGDG